MRTLLSKIIEFIDSKKYRERKDRNEINLVREKGRRFYVRISKFVALTIRIKVIKMSERK